MVLEEEAEEIDSHLLKNTQLNEKGQETQHVTILVFVPAVVHL